MTASGRRKGGLVYSTEHGTMCPACGNPVGRCTCRKDAGRATVPPGRPIEVRRETSGRKGKEVTLITNLPIDTGGLGELCRELKKKCGSGGTVKEGAIEIQGDHRDRVVDVLTEKGLKVRKR